jgi:CheY-like chemotaxis protein
VLVVEDNPINLRVALLSLKKLGIEAETCSNGREAVECFQTGRWDVVFMDIQMPGLDGIQATQNIRQNVDADRQPFIVALTAHAMGAHRDQCRNAGMNAFLAKPFSSDDLAAVVALYQEHRGDAANRCFF